MENFIGLYVRVNRDDRKGFCDIIIFGRTFLQAHSNTYLSGLGGAVASDKAVLTGGGNEDGARTEGESSTCEGAIPKARGEQLQRPPSRHKEPPRALWMDMENLRSS